MSNNDTDRCGASFYRTRGIINGALWYSFAGGKLMLPPKRNSKLEVFSALFSFKIWLHNVLLFRKVGKLKMQFQSCFRKIYSHWETLINLLFIFLYFFILMLLVIYKYLVSCHHSLYHCNYIILCYFFF